MTAAPTALLTLATEVEAATGPDRELDARVWVALMGGTICIEHFECDGVDRFVWRGRIFTGSNPLDYVDTPKLTASGDAAFALLTDVLPDWRAKILATRSAGCSADVELWDEGGRLLQISSGKAPTLPRAIVAALLRAVAARDG